MALRSSARRPERAARQNIVRPTAESVGDNLDDTDLAILETLVAEGRLPNNALAERVGIAPSTCLNRVRALREAGVIRGFHADVDPARLGRPIQAMIAVQMQAHARGHLTSFMREVAAAPGVLNLFLLGGVHDFFIHVAAPTVDALREFAIENLSGNPDVALTETNLIFEHLRPTFGPLQG